MKKKELTLAAILVCGIIGCTDKNPKISEKLDNAYNVIEGKWEIVHSEFSGRVSTSSNGTVDRIVDNEWIRPNRRTGVYTLKLNPKSNPKEVDLSANRLVNESLKGIYKIIKKIYEICKDIHRIIKGICDFLKQTYEHL